MANGVVANVAINVETANAIQTLNRVKAATGGTQTALAAATKGAQGFGAALGAALGPILGITTALGAVGKAMNVFQERQADIAVLRNGLTGLVADVEGVSAGLQVMADEFGKVTLFSEEDFMEGAQMLTSFRDIAVSSYQDVINTAGDVAQVMGTDVNSSLLQLAKALQDPVAGLTALSRSGIQFTESQKETIKSMVEAGNAAGAQALILGELQTQYGGAAAAAGSAGFAGAMDSLVEVTNDAFEILGKALDPALSAVLNLLSQGVQTLADWWNYLGSEVLPRVVDAVQPVVDALRNAFEDVDFDIIRVAIQSIIIFGLEIAIGLIRDFSNLLAFVINGFKKLSQNPVFQFIAQQVGNLAKMLGLTNDKVGEFKQKQLEAGEAQKEAVANAVNLSNKTEDAALSSDKLKEAQKEVTNQIQEASEAAGALQAKLTTGVDQRLAVTESYLKAEMAVNDVLLQQAERQLDAASTGAERLRAAQDIYNLTIRQAELELKSTQATIAAELDKARIAGESTQLKERELAAVVNLAIAQKAVTSAHFEALKAQQQAVAIAGRQLTVAEAVAVQQSRAADAVYRGKVAAAEAAFQQNIVAKNTNTAANEAGRFADNMERAAGAAQATSNAMGSMPGQGTGYANFGEAGKNAAFAAEWSREIKELNSQVMSATSAQRAYNELLNQFMDKAAAYNKAIAAERFKAAAEDWAKRTGQKTPGYASGGYVTRPQLAMIGEGGQPEYVIPSSKMDQAMANYAAGRRGSQVLSPQVNITTGPVTQMDGTNYVTMGDLRQATSAAAQQGANLALSQLQNNPSVRRSVGVRS